MRAATASISASLYHRILSGWTRTLSRVESKASVEGLHSGGCVDSLLLFVLSTQSWSCVRLQAKYASSDRGDWLSVCHEGLTGLSQRTDVAKDDRTALVSQGSLRQSGHSSSRSLVIRAIHQRKRALVRLRLSCVAETHQGYSWSLRWSFWSFSELPSRATQSGRSKQVYRGGIGATRRMSATGEDSGLQ
jgi:hypothetical protein